MTTPGGTGVPALPGGDQLEAAQARLEQAKAASESIRQRIESSTFKASPKNKLFTVTVDGRGELKTLVFRGDDYRELPPAELADLLVTTVAKARKESMAAAMGGMGDLTSRSRLPMEELSRASSLEEFMGTIIAATDQALPPDSQLLPNPKERS